MTVIDDLQVVAWPSEQRGNRFRSGSPVRVRPARARGDRPGPARPGAGHLH